MSNLNLCIKNLLCPPGNGVFTVNTAKERKQTLHNILYPKATSPEAIEQSWLESIQATKFQKKSKFLLGIPSDAGAGIVRGSNWGPLYLRNYLHTNFSEAVKKTIDLGDVRVIPHLLHDKYLNSQTIENCREKLYCDKNAPYPVSPLSMTEYFLDVFYAENPSAQIFAMGGDHSVSYPLVRSYLKKQKKQGINSALIHFDAHTDLMDIRLGIDLCFGTWTYHIMEELTSPDHIIQLGIRSSGQDRNHWESKFKIKQYWAQEILDANIEKFTANIIAHLKKIQIQELYISFDIDAMDASIASATGTPETQGIFSHHAHSIINALKQEFEITGGDMVEVAPFVSYPEIEVKFPEPDNTLMTASGIFVNLFSEIY